MNHPDPCLNLFYVHAPKIGYGRMGVKLAAAIEAQGVTVYDHLEGSDNAFAFDASYKPPIDLGPGAPLVADLSNKRRSGVAKVACWASVPSHVGGWYDGQIPMIFTMWEGTRLPESMREGLHGFETVIVPSYHNRDLFSQFHDNVRYMPLGVDTTEWQYQARRPADREFLYMCGGSGLRKGVDLVARAFKTLWGKEGSWGDGPVPRLMLKSPKGGPYHGPRIEIIGGYVPADTEVALYANAHCYVQPSRGEGFGFQPLQAIAQGCPTILTNAHGHESYAQLGIPLGWTHSKAEYFVAGDAGDWWEPDFDELVHHMRWVYEHYDEACAHAKVGAKMAAENFAWPVIGDEFLNIIGRENLRPYDGPGTWRQIDHKMYRVELRRAHYHEVAERAYSYVAGETYYVPADVKRILFEANLLTPECIEEDDNGLTQEQLDAYHGNRQRFADCPTCGQPLPSDRERAGV